MFIQHLWPYPWLKSHTFYLNPMHLLSGKYFVNVKNEVHPLLFGLGGVFYCSGAAQCFSNWIPQRCVWGFERRKCVMAVLNLYIRIKIRVATCDINHSVTDSTQTINRCFNPEVSWSIVKSVSSARHRQSQCFRRNDQVTDEFEVSRWFLYVQCT